MSAYLTTISGRQCSGCERKSVRLWWFVPVSGAFFWWVCLRRYTWVPRSFGGRRSRVRSQGVAQAAGRARARLPL